MRIASRDRAELLGVAGAGHLSPAVQDGVPALLPEGDGAGRTGWEAFFAALDRSGLVVAWEEEDPGSARPVAAAQALPLERHPTFADGVDRARRFLAAWKGAPPPSAG